MKKHPLGQFWRIWEALGEHLGKSSKSESSFSGFEMKKSRWWGLGTPHLDPKMAQVRPKLAPCWPQVDPNWAPRETKKPLTNSLLFWLIYSRFWTGFRAQLGHPKRPKINQKSLKIWTVFPLFFTSIFNKNFPPARLFLPDQVIMHQNNFLFVLKYKQDLN